MPKCLAVSMNPGKDVATFLQLLIIIGALAIIPAIEKAIAIR